MSNYKTVNIEQICFLIQAKKRDSLDVSKYHILLYILIQEQSITNVDFNMGFGEGSVLGPIMYLVMSINT